jgi:hypothetical protein
MKKNILCLILFTALISCTTDVKFNNPAFEGQKNNVFWRAVDSKAYLLEDGSLIVEAYTRNEKVTLKTVSNVAQTYSLGISDTTIASYVLTDVNGSTTFSTGNGIGNGEIVITEFDAVNKTVTGTFKFNADNSLTGLTLNFQYGIFYKVPVTTSFIN